MTDNLPIRIHGKKIENKITFIAKTGYYHELSTPKRWYYLEVLKIKYIKIKIVKFCLN